jgi:hypothetical protein
MNLIQKKQVLSEFEKIPGVGKSIALDLWELGLRSISELRNNDPEKLYAKHCKQKGQPVDRCLLYVFRCAVYFASHKKHNPKLLLWWNWKDALQTP